MESPTPPPAVCIVLAVTIGQQGVPRRYHPRERDAQPAQALDLARRLSDSVEVAEVHRLHARMLRERARPEDENRAEEFLHLALDDYVRFGMPDYAAEAERMLSATSRSF
jgi:hypothetical protein